ncbi:MAG: hypothetical protein ACHP78_03885 [Terriglobales bacterium]
MSNPAKYGYTGPSDSGAVRPVNYPTGPAGINETAPAHVPGAVKRTEQPYDVGGEQQAHDVVQSGGGAGLGTDAGEEGMGEQAVAQEVEHQLPTPSNIIGGFEAGAEIGKSVATGEIVDPRSYGFDQSPLESSLPTQMTHAQIREQCQERIDRGHLE